MALVTGVTGCVGRAVAAALAESGWSVRGLVRAPSPEATRYAEHLGDLTDPASLRGSCEGVQLVVHAAADLSDWRPGRRIWQVNRDGTRAILDEALRSGVTRFVYLSTVDVFGFDARRVIDEASPKRVPPYAYSRSKLAGEDLAWSYHRRGLEITVIYPTWIFGPGDRHFVPELVRGLRDNKLVHFDRGVAPIELTYSENLADAIVLAGTTPDCAGGRFIVGDSYGLTVGQLFERIAERIGVPPPTRSIPFSGALAVAALSELAGLAGIGTGTGRPMLTRYAVRSVAGGMRYDLDRIRSIGYSPRVPVSDALSRAVAGLEEGAGHGSR
ncbi:NAD-dependent epimerase/dehydratase family protein [Plantactinospora sp. S1510]|uniref:NAD-dependent epimerase/dehydratase family protein n=1 Tax=Plantactinospora alkalitolerans TaxID=2789879 RepID=A0ABS0H9U9_9ACTN|nr:NAD-dependent epimerase/dehydratase family protein [Plantactinospora alkalitolerans]MBF9134862.1 NAD-dependent epimerase/dehydratase family protein [Plantactinospora alkalitolerans]